MKSIKVEPVRSKSADTNSNIIQISLKTPDPDIGKKALSKLLEIYASFDAKLNQKAGRNAYAIVKKKMKQSYQQVTTAQKRLTDFLSNNNFIRRSSRVRISSSYLGSNPAKSPDNNNHTVSSLAGKMISSPRDDTTIAVLKAKLIEMELQLVEYKQNYKGSNEKLSRLQHSIGLLRKRIDHEMGAYAQNESRLRTLERDLQASESIYLQLKKRLAQIDLFLEINKKQPGTRIIVEPPIIPLESESKKDLFILIAGSFGGLFLGLGIAGFREFTDHGLKNRREVLHHLGLDTLATIPTIHTKGSCDAEHVSEQKENLAS